MDRASSFRGHVVAYLSRRFQRPSRLSPRVRTKARWRVGLRHRDLVHPGRRGAVFDAVRPSFVNRPPADDDHSLEYSGRPIRRFSADRALHFVPADLIVRWLGDQPPVSETATVIPARGATGLSMAIIAAPAFSSGMRSAISSPRSSRPSVIIASMAG